MPSPTGLFLVVSAVTANYGDMIPFNIFILKSSVCSEGKTPAVHTLEPNFFQFSNIRKTHIPPFIEPEGKLIGPSEQVKVPTQLATTVTSTVFYPAKCHNSYAK